MIETRHRLGKERQRLQADTDAFRARRELLKASYTAAHASLLAHETIVTMGPAGDGGDRRQEDHDEAISTPEARLLRDVTAQMERELGHQAWPQGLMELRICCARRGLARHPKQPRTAMTTRGSS